MKKCKKCKIEKDLVHFYIVRTNLSKSRESWCKQCRNEYSRQYRIDNKSTKVKTKIKNEPGYDGSGGVEWVYIMTHPKFLDSFKVGMTKKDSPFDRLGSYQTGDPFRRYEFVYLAMVKCGRSVEDEVACEFEEFNITGTEWYTPNSSSICKEKRRQGLIKRIISHIESSDLFLRSL